MNKFLSVFCALAACCMTGQGISLMDTEKWKSDYPKAVFESSDEDVTVTQSLQVRIAQKFKCDAGSLYVISGMIKTSVPKATLSIALKLYNSKGQRFTTGNYIPIVESLTTVVEDVPKGAKSIKVKDISKWNKDCLGYCGLACNAKADLSDIPNMEVSIIQVGKTEQKDGYVLLELKTPVYAPIAAGTPIRQHLFGGADYVKMNLPCGSEWTKFSAHLQGIRKPGQNLANSFPPGTAEFEVELFFNGIKVTDKVQLKELKISEE